MTNLRLAAILTIAVAAAVLLLRPDGAEVPNRSSATGNRVADPSPPVSDAAANPTIVPESPQAPQTRDASRADTARTPVRASVRGLIRNASGVPLDGVRILARNFTANGSELARSSAVSDYHGEFILEQLLPGRQYQLEITPQDGYSAFDLEPFVAGQSENLPDIVLRHVDLVDVDGMVIDFNQAPLADFEFSIRSLSTEFPDRIAQSDSTGFFSLRQFPAGEIRVATNASDYFRVEGLELRSDEYHNLVLVIDRGSYHLAGVVSDDSGAPVAVAQVTLESTFDTGEYRSYSYRSTITDANGNFEFSQLGGKPVTLGVYASDFENHSENHRFGSYSDFISVKLSRQQP